MRKSHLKSKIVVFNMKSELGRKLFNVNDYHREYIVLQTEMLPTHIPYEMMAEIVKVDEYAVVGVL
jgi:hypothetical protein